MAIAEFGVNLDMFTKKLFGAGVTQQHTALCDSIRLIYISVVLKVPPVLLVLRPYYALKLRAQANGTFHLEIA